MQGCGCLIDGSTLGNQLEHLAFTDGQDSALDAKKLDGIFIVLVQQFSAILPELDQSGKSLIVDGKGCIFSAVKECQANQFIFSRHVNWKDDQ